jgi:hypothetical protein
MLTDPGKYADSSSTNLGHSLEIVSIKALRGEI